MRTALAVILVMGAAAAARADQASELRVQAYEHAYNLDRDRATDLFQRALALDRESAATHRGIATLNWLHITFRR